MPQQDLYDLVAYPGFVYPHTHPGNLAAIALLHELEAPPVERCRVLEIGCSEGANLIPMAYAMPGSEFIGFDLAAAPIARGQQRIRQLGLTNIQLLQANLMDLDASLGRFDYIIAHGVYAWVPEPVRDRLQALCSECLTPNGVAFISYNALPGGHIRNLIGDILQSGSAGATDALQGVHQGIELLRILAESRSADDPYRILLEHELERLRKRPNPHVTFHDELSPSHRPVSFTAFAGHAAQHGLQPLAEATLPPPSDPLYNPQLTNLARNLSGGDPIAFEQILDLVRMRRYRETLLCRADRALDPDLSVRYLDRLFFSCAATLGPANDASSRTFILPDAGSIESRHPAIIFLLERLIETWPRPLAFPQIASLLAAQSLALDPLFFRLLFQLIVAQVVQISAWAAPVGSALAPRPTASAVARLEAQTAQQATTLLHGSLDLTDPLVRDLLLLLDGTRDRGALLETLRQRHPEVSAAALASGLEPSLLLLQRSGVLLAAS